MLKHQRGQLIFGNERARLLNRAKITLPVLSHSTEFKENVHYVSAKIEDLANTIVYYLEHEEERRQIADSAYELMMAELRFED